jgi:hypothetical protein
MPEGHAPPGTPVPDGLVAALRDAGERLALPGPGPAAAALERIGTPEPGPRRAGRSPDRRARPGRPVAAAAAVLAVALGVTVAVPGSRQAVARWLGIGRVSITYGGEVPADAGRTYDLGRPVPVAQAAERAQARGWSLAAPAGAGDPDRAFVDRPAGAVTLTWAPSPELPEVGGSGIGLLLAALPGTTDAGGVSKQIGPGTTVELVQLGDGPAYWIAGEPHAVLVVDPGGRVVADATRLAGNTLVWTDGGVTYRLESALEREGALELASGLTTGRAAGFR